MFRRMYASVQRATLACAANSPNALFLVSMEANARALTSADVRTNTKAITAKSQSHARRNVQHVTSRVNMEPVNRATSANAILAGTESIAAKTSRGLRG